MLDKSDLKQIEDNQYVMQRQAQFAILGEFAGGLGYLIGGHFKYNGNKECRLIDTAIRNYIEYRIDKEHFKENKSTGRYPQDELLEVVNLIIR